MASKKKSSVSAFDEALSKPLLSSSSSRVNTRKLKLSTPPPPASSFKKSILPSSGSASSSYYSPPNTAATANSQKNPFEEDDHMSQDTTKSLNNNNAPSNSADEQIRQELLGSDLDVELCRERAEEMVNINSSMKQINNIYKGAKNMLLSISSSSTHKIDLQCTYLPFCPVFALPLPTVIKILL